MSNNLLINGDFEGGYRPIWDESTQTKPHHIAYVYEVNVTGGPVAKRYTVERAEIHNPAGWWAWYAHQRNNNPVPWDPNNRIGWAEPEVRLTETVHKRHRSGLVAAYLFTWRRIHEGGLLQQVSVTPGARLRFTAYTHAWIGDDDHPPIWSLPGYGALAWPAGTPGLNDDQRSVTQSIGIDPTGGTDPYAPTVIWSPGWHIFNAYRAEPLAVEAVATGNMVTVFLRSSTLWPVVHNDVAWDDCALVVVGGDEPGPGIPPMDMEKPFVARGTKVGYHCIAPRQVPGHVAQLARQGAPVPLVKFVDDWSGMAAVKESSPQTLILARKTFGLDLELVGGLADMSEAEIEQHASYLMSLLRQKCLQEAEHLQYIDYLETVVNEADPKSADGHGYRNLALLMLHMLDIAEKWDLPCKKLALFSLSCGTPEWVDYVAMAETGVFERMQAGGHIISLHEGTLAVGGYTWEEAPIDLWWGPGHTIPGAPDVAGSGSLSFRYRYLLHLLRQRGLYVPIVISEFYAGGGYAGADPAAILARLRWYDELAAADPEVLAFTPFTFGGAGVGWDEQDYDFMLPVLYDYTLAVKARVNAAPVQRPGGLEHVVTVNLLPQDTTLAELHEVTAHLHPGRRSFVYSADDAAYLAAGGKPGSKVVVWNAGRWDGDIEAYLRARGVTEVVLAEFGEFETPDVPGTVPVYSQNDPRWKDLIYSGNATFGSNGCLVTCVAMLAGVEPPEAARRLREAGAFNGAFLSNPARIPQALPQLDYGGHRHWREAGQLADLNLLRQEIIAHGATICEVRWDPAKGGPVPGNQHFVVVVAISGDDAQIIDPWDGQRKALRGSRYCLGHETAADALTGVRLVRRGGAATPPVTPPSGPVLFGIHDEDGDNGETGAQWMASRGLRGLIVRPVYLGTHAQLLDFSAAEAAGLRVIVNLRYSWAVDNGGQGTLPRPESPAWTLFVQAAAQTMIVSRGVWGWEISNEANNPREWPHGGTLLPVQLAEAYNAIRELVWASTARPRMTPGALDPFNAQAGDPRDWLREVWNRISGAEFVAAHGYVRGPNPNLVGSAARFADAPLQWQYLNYPGCITELLKSLPAQWVTLPVYVTEFNHLYKTAEPDWGWVSDARAAEVVRAAYQAASQAGFAGLALYRWAGDEWRIQGNTAVLNALEALLRE